MSNKIKRIVRQLVTEKDYSVTETAELLYMNRQSLSAILNAKRPFQSIELEILPKFLTSR